MSKIIEKSRLEKLPKDIQRYIADIESERDTAVKTLNEWVCGQSLSNIFVTDFVCLGEKKTANSNPPSVKTFYIPSHRVTIENKGVVVEARVSDNGVKISFSKDTNVKLEYADFVAMRSDGFGSVEFVLARPNPTE